MMVGVAPHRRLRAHCKAKTVIVERQAGPRNGCQSEITNPVFGQGINIVDIFAPDIDPQIQCRLADPDCCRRIFLGRFDQRRRAIQFLSGSGGACQYGQG